MPILYQESSYDKFQAKIEKHRHINKMLVYLVVALTVFVLIYTVALLVRYGRFDIRKFQASVPAEKGQLSEPRQDDRPFDVEVFSQRDIFKPSDMAGGTSRSELKKLAQFKQAIRVVGITFDQEYQAIVENIFTKEIMFVQKDDEVMGATVREIMDDRVIFQLDQEKIEIQP